MKWRFRAISSALILTAVVFPLKRLEALMITPNPVPIRVATSDLVIVGKVLGFADQLVPSKLTPTDNREMQIARVEVSETVFGADQKEIRLGFFPARAFAPNGPRPPAGRVPGLQLMVGQEFLAFLTRHPIRKDVYVARMFTDVISKKDSPSFASDLELAKKSAKMLANSKSGLTSDDAKLSLTTAAMLVYRYRVPPGGNLEREILEDISAEESKLILEAISRADWNLVRSNDRLNNPLLLFLYLGLTDKDGWTLPEDKAQLKIQAKKWLQERKATYRIRRFVRNGENHPSAEPEKEK
ncbi:MAG: hypothetical protein ACKO23_12980 [Gemmataceae bacterium]